MENGIGTRTFKENSKNHQKGSALEEIKDDVEVEIASEISPDVNASPSSSVRPSKLSSASNPDMDNYMASEQIFDKNEILEDLSTIFYKTQMLNNNSEMIKDFVGANKSISNILKNLEQLNLDQPEEEPERVKNLATVINNVTDLKGKMEIIINNYETIRGMLYPVAEKIALIELQKNPYRIPGDPYKKVQLNKKSVMTQLKFLIYDFHPKYYTNILLFR